MSTTNLEFRVYYIYFHEIFIFIDYFDISRKLLTCEKTKQRKICEKNGRFRIQDWLLTCDEPVIWLWSFQSCFIFLKN